MAENKDGITIHDEKLGDIKLSASELNALKGNENIPETEEKPPILTNAEYFREEAAILAKNGLVEPTIADEDEDNDEKLMAYKNAMKEFVTKKIELCSELRDRRHQGCYLIGDGLEQGDKDLPREWYDELVWVK